MAYIQRAQQLLQRTTVAIKSVTTFKYSIQTSFSNMSSMDRDDFCSTWRLRSTGVLAWVDNMIDIVGGLGGTTGSALDSRSEGRGFDSH